MIEHSPATCADCSRDRKFLQSTVRPTVPEGARRLALVDLFAGCGGLSLGVAVAAWRSGADVDVLRAVDIDPVTTGVYKLNFPNASAVARDVAKVFDGAFGEPATHVESVEVQSITQGRRRTVDFLVGGPPCQGHSDLNNSTRRSDPRNSLYLVMTRAAELLEPRAVLIENVPSVRHSTEQVVQEAERRLTQLGYSVSHRVFDVSVLGVPQRRKRHILLAVKDQDAVEIFDAVSAAACPPRSVRWAIEDLLECKSNTTFDTVSDLTSEDNLRRMQWFAANPGNYDLPNEHRPACHRDKAHSYKSVYGRLRWEDPAQTITTGFTSMGQGRYVHPQELRTITPHEAARLQGFPDFFTFGDVNRSALSKLIGNAVPPRLAEVVAAQVMAAWERERVPVPVASSEVQRATA